MWITHAVFIACLTNPAQTGICKGMHIGHTKFYSILSLSFTFTFDEIADTITLIRIQKGSKL